MDEGVGLFMVAFAFWLALLTLGISALMGVVAAAARGRGLGAVLGGLACAGLIVAVPRFALGASDVANGIVGGDQGHGVRGPGVLEYVSSLSDFAQLVAGITAVIWLIALAVTLNSAISSRTGEPR